MDVSSQTKIHKRTVWSDCSFEMSYKEIQIADDSKEPSRIDGRGSTVTAVQCSTRQYKAVQGSARQYKTVQTGRSERELDDGTKCGAFAGVTRPGRTGGTREQRVGWRGSLPGDVPWTPEASLGSLKTP